MLGTGAAIKGSVLLKSFDFNNTDPLIAFRTAEASRISAAIVMTALIAPLRPTSMIHPWRDLPPGPRPPEEVTAVIEIPRGSRNKYELDKETGMLKLDRVLYSAVHYPGDYGFIPRTLHEDGDPLDILVRINEATFPGCQIDVRPIGVLKMLDRGEPDDKILAVPSHDPQHNEYFDIADLPGHYLKEVEHFFLIYKDLEGKRMEIAGWEKSESALKVITDSMERYADKFLRVGP
jgi:inorganic pyrophosphatase